MAGRREVTLDLRLLNRRSGPSATLAACALTLRTAPPRSAACGVFDAVHRTRRPFALRHGGEGHLRGIFAVAAIEAEHAEWEDASVAGYHDLLEWAELQGRHGSGWVDVETTDDGSGLTVAVARFADDHPSELRVDEDGVRVAFWPATAGPLTLVQGMAASRRVVVAPHAGAGPRGAAPRGARRRAARARRRGARARQRRGPGRAAAPAGAVPAARVARPGRAVLLVPVGQSTGFLDRGDCAAEGPAARGPASRANNEHDATCWRCACTTCARASAPTSSRRRATPTTSSTST